ncbi:MAG: leucine-rich repeat domain-containing protein, partial [Anaeroplasmataceae bacterium]|nr:leucine-rich repeat domain-containing protein [Anaeroplasmataceae bacterium]
MTTFINKVLKKGIIGLIVFVLVAFIFSLNVSASTDTIVSTTDEEIKSSSADDCPDVGNETEVNSSEEIENYALSYYWKYWLPYTSNDNSRPTVSEVYMQYSDSYNPNQNGLVTAINDTNGDGKVAIAQSYGKRHDSGYRVYPAIIGDQDNAITGGSWSKPVKEISFPSSTITISNNAFKGNKELEIVDLSESSVSYIGVSAFEGCTNLKEVRLPKGNTLKTIGANAFKDCPNLLSKYDPSKYNNGLLKLDSVTSIGANAFENDDKIHYLTLGDGIITLGNEAFKNCQHLEQITLPASLTSIGKSVFYNCTTLSNAYVRTNILSEGLFEQCSSLTTIELNDNITIIPKATFKHTLSTSINFPNALTKICESAFEGASILSFTLPDATLELEKRAFYDCDSLTTFDLNQVEIIGDYAFADSSHPNFTSVTIPASVTTLGDHVFSECKNLSTAIIETNVLGTYMFAGCDSFMYPVYNKLNEITITPEGMFENAINFKDSQLLDSPLVVEIGHRAYYNTAFTSVEILSSVETVGNYVFADCTSLNSAVVHSQMMGERMFKGSSLSSITIGSEPTEIGQYACAEMDYLTTINFEGTTTLGDYMFADCGNLVQVTIPSTIVNFGKHVFSRDTKLTTLTLESEVLGEYMIEDCISLKTIILTHIKVLTDYA